MKITKWLWSVLLLVSFAHAQNVTITKDGDERKVRAANYEATVGNDGALTSLIIGGQQFLNIGASKISRGLYLHQGASLKLTQIEQPTPSSITAKNEAGSVRYDFAPDGMTWTATNTSGKAMNFYAVFDENVAAAQGDGAQWAKPPINQPWQKSAWFRGNAKLEINGGTRVWGPFGGQFQVWEQQLPAGETRTINVKIGTATAEEVAKVAQAAAQPATAVAAPPPAAVTTAAPGNLRKITQPTYEASVTDNGAVWSLKIGGQEFLKAGLDISRGAYFYQGGNVDLPQIEQPDANTIVAKGPKASARYEFKPDSATWTVTNATAQPMLFFLVLDPAVNVARNEDGTWAKGPLGQPWKKSTWFRGKSKLEVSGTTRVWGPWENVHQVLETALAANETRTIELRPGTATAEEAAKVVEMAGKPAPQPAVQPAVVPAAPVVPDADLMVFSPRTYQVVQRLTRTRGEMLFGGRVKPDCDAVEARLTGKTLEANPPAELNWSNWRKLPFNAALHSFNALLPVPAGGWYKVELRATKGGKAVAEATVENVGVGEVFVGAGQSNSTNYGGDGGLKVETGMVSTFSGSDWRVADDPQPGVHDKSTKGSFWPAFGDAMYKKYNVPIGVAVTGHGGTSTNAWQPGSELFNWTMTRIYQLGPFGFRALLWHQGESDTGMSSDEYERKLTNVILGTKAAAGWDFPWFVAQVSYHNPDQPRFDSTRNAQKAIWDKGIALEGPDTDTLTGDMRDSGGKGIHLSPKGRIAHGQMWAEKVGAYLDKVLDK